MVAKVAILTSLLLASVALAVPSHSRLGARLARRRENRQSKPISYIGVSTNVTSNTLYDQNWAGAVWDENEGTFTTVTGTFSVPTPSGSDGSAAAWVGIDGYSCGNAILQTGVDFTIANGKVSYDAWYEWFPDYAYDFDGITINSGDEIRATVTAFSTTSGKAVIENLTTGQTVTQELSSSASLCEQDAGWIVEDYLHDGSQVTLADFGTVTFTSATASGPGISGSSYTPNGATLLDIQQNEILTSSSVSGNTLTVKYV